MKNKILYLLLIILVLFGVGLIIFIKTDFNSEKTENEEEFLEETYHKLNDKLIEYLDDIYNNGTWMNKEHEQLEIHTVTLKEFQEKGYDISMFVNPITGLSCDLNETYGEFIIIATEGKETEFSYSSTLACE